MVESSDSFFDGRIAVWPMCVDQVHIFETKTFERGVYALNYVFAGETTVIYGIVAVGSAPVYLYPVRRGYNLMESGCTLVDTTISFLFQPNFLIA